MPFRTRRLTFDVLLSVYRRQAPSILTHLKVRAACERWWGEQSYGGGADEVWRCSGMHTSAALEI
jgi:hypothetical protein